MGCAENRLSDPLKAEKPCQGAHTWLIIAVPLAAATLLDMQTHLWIPDISTGAASMDSPDIH